MSRTTFAKSATPMTAVAVTDPERSPPPGLFARPKATLPEKEVATLP